MSQDRYIYLRMTQGKLIKINSNKKLMINIDEKTYNALKDKALKYAKAFNLPEKLPTFELEKDGKKGYFVMVSLDKYDKQKMGMFEKMTKKNVSFDGSFTKYDFLPPTESSIPRDEEERVRGFNYVLNTSMRVIHDKQEENKQ